MSWITNCKQLSAVNGSKLKMFFHCLISLILVYRHIYTVLNITNEKMQGIRDLSSGIFQRSIQSARKRMVENEV